ncbi:MAG TPA: entericidin A/B family lipoprotein [bacterium]|nr:entericidin A/B family lipoprotein [bacterium]
MKLKITFTVGLLLIVFLTGCNTMRGVGQDIEKAGEAIQKSTK